MKFGRPKHKGLRLLVERGDPRKLQPDLVGRLMDTLAILEAMTSTDQLSQFPQLRPHVLKGDRKGQVSLSLSGNWRLVFDVDEEEQEVTGLDIVDYH